MNRRRLLQALAAMPVVAALAPYFPKVELGLPTAVSHVPARVIAPPRFLRYRIAWPVGKTAFNPASVVRISSYSDQVESYENADTFFVPRPSFTGRIEAEGIPDDVAIIPEESFDGLTWGPSDIRVVRV